MKNFIVENKKRIRSRSRNNEKRNQTSKKTTASRSIIKKSKEIIFGTSEDNGETQFMTFCEQGIQTINEDQKQTIDHNMSNQPERGLFNDDND